MRKLTPAERAAKKAALASAGAPAEHVHDDNCGHFVDTKAPTTPKRKKKEDEPVATEEPKAEAVAPAPVVEAPVAKPSPVAKPAPDVAVEEVVAEESAPEA